MATRKLSTIYVLGLGAIGATYAAKLHDHLPQHVKVLADAARSAVYRRAGLTVNGHPYAFDFVEPSAGAPKADLILVAVKHPQLPEAIRMLQPVVGPDTIVLSLLNGISSEDLIGQVIGPEHLLYSYVYMDAVREGRAVRYNQLGEIVFGEALNHHLSARVRAVKELFTAAGIPHQVPPDMRRALWTKFLLNVGVNQTSALLKAPYGVFQQSTHARELMVVAAREVVALAQAQGIALGEADIEYCVATINRLDPASKTSMLQDLEAGRPTEVEAFAGVVIALGHHYQVPTPVNNLLYKALCVSEQYPLLTTATVLKA